MAFTIMDTEAQCLIFLQLEYYQCHPLRLGLNYAVMGYQLLNFGYLELLVFGLAQSGAKWTG